eukprot:PLAT5490.1.p1 GENE.PLAT5490.1~~PLAT5490.1.p1  ORF type:complete len:516 (-),score=251.61 PLAT5490.1:81-1505(-)
MNELLQERTEFVKGELPSFWLSVFRGRGMPMQKSDESAIRALEEITCEYLKSDGPHGFRLVFKFGDNDLFSNRLLTKTYHEGPKELRSVFSHIGHGCRILWKDETDAVAVGGEEGEAGDSGKESKKAKKDKKKKKKGKKDKRKKGFFSFFTPPQLPEPDVLTDRLAVDPEPVKRLLKRVSDDAELGILIRDELLPNAVDYFMDGAHLDAVEEATETRLDDFAERVAVLQREQLLERQGKQLELESLVVKPLDEKRSALLARVPAFWTELLRAVPHTSASMRGDSSVLDSLTSITSKLMAAEAAGDPLGFQLCFQFEDNELISSDKVLLTFASSSEGAVFCTSSEVELKCDVPSFACPMVKFILRGSGAVSDDDFLLASVIHQKLTRLPILVHERLGGGEAADGGDSSEEEGDSEGKVDVGEAAARAERSRAAKKKGGLMKGMKCSHIFVMALFFSGPLIMSIDYIMQAYQRFFG